ncbi:FMN-dependent monooxygenase [Mycolicibacterium sp. P9-64]|nr:FMN-dependent monooxygenase [Mycolicibacterium sp. P9-64]
MGRCRERDILNACQLLGDMSPTLEERAFSMAKKRMILNAFTSQKVHHYSMGGWKHPQHTIDQGCFTTEYWTRLAQTLERGFFDGIFFAHTDGVYDVYKDSPRTGIEQGAHFPQEEPPLVLSAMAAATKHLGLITTLSTSYHNPYFAAKLFTTLDHLTEGRVAWNIVTSFTKSGAENNGVPPQPHDERYERSQEYMDIVYKFWEHSWEDDAYVRDREKDIYIDADKVHYIDHEGKWYGKIPGPHLCGPSIQRTPLLFQAGQSAAGVGFAAKHAECVFSILPTIARAKKHVQDVVEQAAKFGRTRDDLKFVNSMCVVTAPTDEEAEMKAKFIRSNSSYEGALALLSGMAGVDLSQLSPTQSIDALSEDDVVGIKGFSGIFKAIDPDRHWTMDDIAEYTSLGGVNPVIIGSPQTVADKLEEWIDESDLDGFNIYAPVHPASFHDFVDLVVPELQRRGRARTEYDSTTVRENFFGAGEKRLRPNHYAFSDAVLPPWRKAVQAANA